MYSTFTLKKLFSRPMAEHIQKGKYGEELAKKYLEKQGYTILETNWRYKNLEIDLIALDGNALCVIEVKTRSTDVFGEPEVFVTSSKQQKLIKAINMYIRKTTCEKEIRFDIVSIIENKELCKINLIKDAFYPKYRARK